MYFSSERRVLLQKIKVLVYDEKKIERRKLMSRVSLTREITMSGKIQNHIKREV